MADRNSSPPGGPAAFSTRPATPARATNPVGRAAGLYESGNYKQVIALCEKVLPDSRQYADAQQLIGLAKDKLGDKPAAVRHLSRAAELDSANSKLQSSLGGVLAQLGRVEEAAKAHRAALDADSKNTYVLYGLGRIAEDAGQQKPALRYYRKVLDLDPRDLIHGANLRLSQLGARKMLPRTPIAYMRQFYAGRARTWRNPAGRRYRGYDDLKELLAAYCSDGRRRRILDAGCGAGGLAPVLKQYAQTLDGVDLSGDMIFWAKATAQYDILEEAELCGFLKPRKNCYDLIVAAAVLIHFSDLNPVFKRVRQALDNNGLWMFTVFHNPDQNHEYSVNNFNMFSHSTTYIEQLAQKFDFEILTQQKMVHEFHGEKPIEAQVFCLRAP